MWCDNAGKTIGMERKEILWGQLSHTHFVVHCKCLPFCKLNIAVYNVKQSYIQLVRSSSNWNGAVISFGHNAYLHLLVGS
jgi:hypothetical protein